MSEIQLIETPQPHNPRAPIPVYAYAGLAVPMVMLMLCIGCTWDGMKRTSEVDRQQVEILEATPQERRVLRAFGVSENTPQGQHKLKKYRQQQEQLVAIRERMIERYEKAHGNRNRGPRPQYIQPQEGVQTLVYSLQVRDAPSPLGGS